MADLTSMLHMRGFVCAVQREDGEPQASSIAVGLDVEGDNVGIAIGIRHADGTTLTAFLSDTLLDRLAHRIASLVGERPATPAHPTVTIQ